jgi:hypothetical protein
MTEQFEIECVPGDKYESQEHCQSANLEAWAQQIAHCLRAGLASGKYVIGIGGNIELCDKINDAPGETKMRLLIDRKTGRQAKLITSTTEYGQVRRYYEVKEALLVLHDDLTIEQIVHRVVDAQTGWDIIQPGFTLDEARIRTRRTKITVRRVLTGTKHQSRLADLL